MSLTNLSLHDSDMGGPLMHELQERIDYSFRYQTWLSFVNLNTSLDIVIHQIQEDLNDNFIN